MNLNPEIALYEDNGGSKWEGGAWDPPGPKSSNFVQFWENLAKAYVGTPLPGGLVPPLMGNPGSAPGRFW